VKVGCYVPTRRSIVASRRSFGRRTGKIGDGKIFVLSGRAGGAQPHRRAGERHIKKESRGGCPVHREVPSVEAREGPCGGKGSGTKISAYRSPDFSTLSDRRLLGNSARSTRTCVIASWSAPCACSLAWMRAHPRSRRPRVVFERVLAADWRPRRKRRAPSKTAHVHFVARLHVEQISHAIAASLANGCRKAAPPARGTRYRTRAHSWDRGSHISSLYPSSVCTRLFSLWKLITPFR